MKYIRDPGPGRPTHLAKDLCDCTIRAISIALGKNYNRVAQDVLAVAQRRRLSCTRGLPNYVTRRILTQHGWRRYVGDGLPLAMSLLPKTGRIIVDIAAPRKGEMGHITAVIDHALHDLEDCREGHVKAFWLAPSPKP